MHGDVDNGVVELDGSAGDLTIPEHFRVESRTLANGTPHIRNVAGNNTITGYVIPSFDGGIANGADAVILESAGGNLQITGGVATNVAGKTYNLYLQGSSTGEIQGDSISDQPVTGISDDVDTSFFNVTKRGSGTWTIGENTPNTYRGTTTIEEGKYIMNGNHSFDINPYSITGSIGDYAVKTGGTLGGKGTIGSATVPINVNVQDGSIAPGDNTGTTTGTLTVNGNFSLLGSSLLNYELTDNDFTVGSAINDLVSVGGNLTLDGTLNVTPIGNSELATAGSYRLFDYTGSLTNNGLSLGSIPLAAGLSAAIDTSTAGQVNLLVHLAGSLAGDYNGDGKVDGADYVVWRKDPASHGGDPAGYSTWRANFGASGGLGAGLSSGSAVPEPAAASLMLLSLVGICLQCPAPRSKRRGRA